MAKDDYRFEDETAFRAWVRTRPPGQVWQYVGGYAVLKDGLWDGAVWHDAAPDPAPSPRPRLRERLARVMAARHRRPDFGTTEKFLDWSDRKRDGS